MLGKYLGFHIGKYSKFDKDKVILHIIESQVL